jgi:hypothetical protein
VVGDGQAQADSDSDGHRRLPQDDGDDRSNDPDRDGRERGASYDPVYFSKGKCSQHVIGSCLGWQW